MRRATGFLSVAVLLFVIASGAVLAEGGDTEPSGSASGASASGASASGASEGSGGQPWLYLGPRIGITGAISNQSDFNSIIQEVFPRSEWYFPLYSQLGLSVQERIPLSRNGYLLVIKQWLLVGGLDQNVAYPLGSLMLAFRFPFGLEVGLGPALGMQRGGETVVVAPSLVYTLGWHLTAGSLDIPILLLVEPLPPDRKTRLSLISGLDFGFRPRLPKKKAPPFNY